MSCRTSAAMTTTVCKITYLKSAVLQQVCKFNPRLRCHSTISELKFDRFVPQSKELDHHEVNRLQQLLTASARLLVLTGAGISTESGIPGKHVLQISNLKS